MVAMTLISQALYRYSCFRTCTQSFFTHLDSDHMHFKESALMIVAQLCVPKTGSTI